MILGANKSRSLNGDRTGQLQQDNTISVSTPSAYTLQFATIKYDFNNYGEFVRGQQDQRAFNLI
tara:strand:- start:806 stop:997 length:192 start_codon:yes stop_codon:yes gene_type:complete